MKRVLDFTLAILTLIVLSPILIFIAALIRLGMGKPIFFSQVRPGFQGRPFKIYKFKTMTTERDGQRNPLRDAERLTPLGVLLRRMSLDELPEIINVIKGDMSIVGPRPLLVQYLDRYTPEQARRHEVKPGITGWAQVNGRNAITWEEKFKYDVWYVDNLNLWLDIKIIFMTIINVIKGEGVNQPGHATMEEFKGGN